RADEVTGQTITEGPLAGQKWGNVFHPTPIAPGEQTVVPVEVPAGTPDKNGDGVITVRAWIDRGPEQHWFAPTVSVDVQLCEPTTPPEEEPGGDDPDNPGEELGGDPGDKPEDPEKPGDGDDKGDEGDDKGAQPSETDDAVAPVTKPGPTTSAPVTVDAVSATDDLADTGASDVLLWLVPAGVALLAAGGGAVWLTRRRGEHGA
ncbi:MAG TPA: LAETG motif-containing sortase-dependent surface protein, partial [Ornithinicoccus sp.]|nr:LAETG motif-containing sortase-dependent surface protein [Ornithinicoccus sp.]